MWWLRNLDACGSKPDYLHVWGLEPKENLFHDLKNSFRVYPAEPPVTCVQTQVNLHRLLGNQKVAFGCSSCFHHLSVSSEAPPRIAATSVVLSEYASQCAVCPFPLPALLHACSDSHRTVRPL